MPGPVERLRDAELRVPGMAAFLAYYLARSPSPLDRVASFALVPSLAGRRAAHRGRIRAVVRVPEPARRPVRASRAAAEGRGAARRLCEGHAPAPGQRHDQ